MITADDLLGATARWTASVRAKESKREDHLFMDPWAADLAGQEGATWIERRSADSMIPIVYPYSLFRRLSGTCHPSEQGSASGVDGRGTGYASLSAQLA